MGAMEKRDSQGCHLNVNFVRSAEVVREDDDCLRHQLERFWAVEKSGVIPDAKVSRTAEDNKGEFSEEVVKTVKRNFYVDNCLKSLKSAEDAVELVDQLRDILSKGGF